ncbi:hypothetical protein GCM10023187_32080 [Nibrella viscosa]|uniref:MG2 domain-containing protein n=1 Tax=Nibrella viscosa TaxID=1084524 RepID=A0ABP8KL76_9BACT
MNRQLIATTTTLGLRPVFGANVGESVRRYQTLRELLSGGEAHAVFAEPVIDGGQIRWFSDLPGRVVPYTELSPDWQEKAGKVLSYYADLAYTQLERYHEADDLRRMLDDCFEVPNYAHLYLIGKRPVLILWGFLSSDFGATHGLVRRLMKQFTAPRLMVNVKVVRVADHAPVADATVTLGHGGQTYRLLTNSEGNASFQAVVPVDPLLFSVEASAPSLATAATTLKAERTVGDLLFDGFYPLITTLALAPKLDREAFSLRVIDLETRQPLIGATVRLTTENTDDSQVTTDAGLVAFDAVLLLAGEKAVAYVTHPSYADERVEIEADAATHTIELNPSGLRGRRGAFSVNLRWFSTDDLDLHVTDPGGNRLNFQQREVTYNDCSGILDLDANADEATATSDPQENAYWEKAHPGFYTIEVVCFKRRSPKGTPIPFEVTVLHGNEQYVRQREAHQEGERVFVDRFSLRRS